MSIFMKHPSVMSLVKGIIENAIYREKATVIYIHRFEKYYCRISYIDGFVKLCVQVPSFVWHRYKDCFASRFCKIDNDDVEVLECEIFSLASIPQPTEKDVIKELLNTYINTLNELDLPF